MEKHPHYGHRIRLRERVRKEGLDNFQDYQVLEYALSFVLPYKDTNPIAHELIAKFGSLSAVLEADEENLQEVKGISEVSAQFLTSILKIYGSYEKEKVNKNGSIKNPEEAYEHVKSFFAGKLIEEIYLVSLLPNNKIVKTERISQGTNSQASITIRKITDAISRNKVNNIIIAHNHPKGIAEPSIEDDNLTKALVLSLSLNDSFLLDHVIVGEDGFYSYRQSGKIDKYRESIKDVLITRGVAQNMAKYGDDYDKK